MVPLVTELRKQKGLCIVIVWMCDLLMLFKMTVVSTFTFYFTASVFPAGYQLVPAMPTLLLQNFLKSSKAVQFLQNFKRYFVSPLGNWFYWLNNDPH